MSDVLHIALIGCGQMGGSLALALKSSGADIHITGFDASSAHATQLHTMGGVDATASSAAEAVKNADIIVLATPLRSYAALLHSIAPHLRSGSIITDVGSVKAPLLSLAPLIPEHCSLVPAHPISGSEHTGPAVANAELFRDKLCVLTPASAEETPGILAIRHLWEAAGSNVRYMPAELHDQLYAYVSHLPHAIAFAAARQFHRHHIMLHAQPPIVAQFLRISRSGVRMWSDIFLENRQALLQSLTMYQAVIAHMEKELRSSPEVAKSEDTSSASMAEVTARLIPHICASALISTVSLYEQQSGVLARNFSAGGLRDVSAPAAESPESISEYASQHASMAAECLAEAHSIMQVLQAAIESGDEAALSDILAEMRDEAVAINQPAH